MNVEERLKAIRETIHQDIGGRGLARDPDANLINACPHDFVAACCSIAEHPAPILGVVTGFYIPAARMGETDGPLGAVYLLRTLASLNIRVVILSDPFCRMALLAGVRAAGIRTEGCVVDLPKAAESGLPLDAPLTHLIALERVGPSHTLESIRLQPGATDETVNAFRIEVPAWHHDRCHTMRAIDITEHMRPAAWLFESARGDKFATCPSSEGPISNRSPRPVTIGIGDGANEIGMGKIAWDTIRRNVPGGSHIACRVPTDHLIVAGVSNWGAYALAAGISLVRGVRPGEEWFDIERERAILTSMVENGPLVDGVTGQQWPRVDGLAFEEYARVLERIGEIVRA